MDRSANFFEARANILEHIVSGTDISETMEVLCRDTEELDPSMRCSVLLLDHEGKCVRHAAAPSLPDFYNEEIDGLNIGIGQGSCGTAAYTGERVIVEDVYSHPYWEAFRELAKEVGISACWSHPILSKHRTVLGTFAMYYNEVRSPTDEELKLIEAQAKLASIAIDRIRSEVALRESESLLESIFENIPIGLLIKDNKHVVEKSNRTYQSWYGDRAKRMLGYKSDDFADFQTEEDARIMYDHEREVLETGKTIRRRVQRPFDDGRMHTLSITKFPIFDQDGKIARVGSASVDVTEQVRAQEVADTALFEAERANKAKSEFIATMSHEFRTPLNAILGFSEMLTMTSFDATTNQRTKEYADIILRSGRMILELVNDILDISAIEAGKRIIRKEPVNIQQLLKDCADHFHPSAKKVGITLNLNIPDNSPPIQADERALKQIVLNLLSNAVKFTPANGTVSITVDASRKGSDAKIMVEDTGIGIPGDILPSITEPFTQSFDNPHHPQLGSGLGLSIVNSLVELHQGQLDIESEVGKGTKITVALPH